MITGRSWNDKLLLPTLFSQVQWRMASSGDLLICHSQTYSNSSPQGEQLLQLLLASLKLFQLLWTSRPPTVGCNSPLQSTWCRRSWSNWIRSLSSKIWLLSEVSDFCLHNSTLSPYCLTRLSSQPSATASWEHRMIGSKGQRAVSGETEQAPHQEPRKHGWNPVEFYLWRTFFGKEVTEAASSQSSFN